MRTKTGISENKLSSLLTKLIVVLKRMGNVVNWPSKMRSFTNQRNKNKWCDFHGDHGHRTDNCIALRLEVIGLLKHGHLSDLLTKKVKRTWPDESNSHMVNNVPLQWLSQHIIELLTPSLAGQSQQDNKGSRTKAHQPSDPSNPKCKSMNCLIKHSMIDNGSSANMLFLETVKAMYVLEENITQRTMVLINFTGEQNNTLGEIMLPVYTEGVNLYTRFPVMDYPLVYNDIARRP
ncbi:Retrotrans gag domain-containing protein [Abeliophyllum distichum]|uniref:Retrotrans gag domain-containing protein n=1 Tax=Abeliophyllum distichum TaxID=126358 RepID=A0ABD1NS82_9LAMI